MSHGKMSDFVSITLFGFTLVINLRNFDFESHWNVPLIFDKERYGVKFQYFTRKMSDFVSFPLFRFTLSWNWAPSILKVIKILLVGKICENIARIRQKVWNLAHKGILGRWFQKLPDPSDPTYGSAAILKSKMAARMEF